MCYKPDNPKSYRQIAEEHAHGRHVLHPSGLLHRPEIRRPMQRPDMLENAAQAVMYALRVLSLRIEGHANAPPSATAPSRPLILLNGLFDLWDNLRGRPIRA